MHTPADFKVAIIGGGIGGLTCALSLAEQCPGIRIDVYEQAAQYKEIGAGVGIAVNAAKILHRLGVGKAANAISGERNNIHRSLRRWDNGEEIVTVDALYDQDEIRQLSVHRAELLKILFDAIRERGIATLHNNKRSVKVVDTSSDEVTLSFEDGTSVTANLLVACDGIHSQTRAQFITDKPRYSGRIAYRGLLPLSAVESFWPFSSYAISWLAPNKHFLVFPISQNKTINVVAFVSKPLEALDDLKESWTSSAPREDLAREFEGWDPVLGKLIHCMEPFPGKWRLNDRELLSQWSFMNGKVVLLGDAAHAMLPHQGSGAGHAIEDCYILGRALHDYFNPPVPTKIPTTLATWTQIYQDVRLPRAQKAQLTSRQAGELYELQGPLFENLTYDESLPIIAEKITGRMKWVWGGDIDAEYNAVVTKTFGKGPGSDGVTSNGVSSDRISSNDITSNGVH